MEKLVSTISLGGSRSDFIEGAEQFPTNQRGKMLKRSDISFIITKAHKVNSWSEYNGHTRLFPILLLVLTRLNQCYDKVDRNIKDIVRCLWSEMEVIISINGSNRVCMVKQYWSWSQEIWHQSLDFTLYLISCVTWKHSILWICFFISKIGISSILPTL